MAIPLVCAGLLMLCTFVMHGDGSGRIPNVVAYLKLLLRTASAGLLGLLVLNRIRSAGGRLLLFLPIVVFLAWAAVTVLWSARPQMSVFQLFSFATLVVLGAAFAVTARTTETRSLALAGLTTYLLLLGLLMIVVRILIPSMDSMGRSGHGLFHATNTAATASLGILLPLSALLLFDWSWPRWLCPVALPVHALVLVLSTSRTALGVTTLLVFGLLIARGDRLLLAVGAALLGLAGAVVLTFDPGFELARDLAPSVEGFLSRGQSKEQLAALSGREELWDVIWDSYLESPWFGHGYFVTSASGELEIWYQEGNFTAHNLYLQVLASTGVVGLVLLLFGVGIPYGYAIVGVAGHAQGWRWAMLLGVLALWYAGWGVLNETFVGPLQAEGVVFFSLLGIGVAAAADTACGPPHLEPGVVA